MNMYRQRLKYAKLGEDWGLSEDMRVISYWYSGLEEMKRGSKPGPDEPTGLDLEMNCLDDIFKKPVSC